MNPNTQAINPIKVSNPPIPMFWTLDGSMIVFDISTNNPKKKTGLPKKSKSLQNHLIFEFNSLSLEFLLKNAHIKLATMLDIIPITKSFITKIVYE